MPNGSLLESGVRPIQASEIAVLLLFRIISEDIEGDPEAAMSLMLGRAVEVLGRWEQMAGLVIAPGTPFDPGACPAIGEVRDMIERSAWLLARMARPLTLPPT